MIIIVLSLVATILVGVAWPVRQRAARRVGPPDAGDTAAWRVVAADTSTLVVAWAMLTLAGVVAAVVIANLAGLAAGPLLGIIAGVACLLAAGGYPAIRFVAVVRCRLRVGDYLARIERNSRRYPHPPQVIAT